jgi:hypothetical protein
MIRWSTINEENESENEENLQENGPNFKCYFGNSFAYNYRSMLFIRGLNKQYIRKLITLFFNLLERCWALFYMPLYCIRFTLFAECSTDCKWSVNTKEINFKKKQNERQCR